MQTSNITDLSIDIDTKKEYIKEVINNLVRYREDRGYWCCDCIFRELFFGKTYSNLKAFNVSLNVDDVHQTFEQPQALASPSILRRFQFEINYDATLQIYRFDDDNNKIEINNDDSLYSALLDKYYQLFNERQEKINQQNIRVSSSEIQPAENDELINLKLYFKNLLDKSSDIESLRSKPFVIKAKGDFTCKVTCENNDKIIVINSGSSALNAKSFKIKITDMELTLFSVFSDLNIVKIENRTDLIKLLNSFKDSIENSRIADDETTGQLRFVDLKPVVSKSNLLPSSVSSIESDTNLPITVSQAKKIFSGGDGFVPLPRQHHVGRFGSYLPRINPQPNLQPLAQESASGQSALGSVNPHRDHKIIASSIQEDLKSSSEVLLVHGKSESITQDFLQSATSLSPQISIPLAHDDARSRGVSSLVSALADSRNEDRDGIVASASLVVAQTRSDINHSGDFDVSNEIIPGLSDSLSHNISGNQS